MSGSPIEWTDFQKATIGRPPRELLRRTLGCFDIEKTPPGIAIDLGCGSGADTIELLRRGWEVHAIDSQPGSLELLTKTISPELGQKLHFHAQRFEDFIFPECSLIWSSYSLPFCLSANWPTLWQRAIQSLTVGGRIAGDLFGPKHAFAIEPDILILTEEEVRKAMATLVVEAFDIEDGHRPSGGEITRWHAFGFAARKPKPESAV